MSAALPIGDRSRDPQGEQRDAREGSSDLTAERRASESGADRRSSPAARVLLGLIAAYRWTAVVRSPRCRFHPTCSTYAAESVRTHGAARGGWLALRRISRCHPWNPGGVDHVPPRN